MRLALRNGRHGTLARIARHMSAGGAALAICAPLWAGPEGERVVSGTAGFDRQGGLTTITAGNNAMIQYNSFNIASNEAVRFVQPTSQSRVFNQIVGNDPTVISGRLDANGIVYIMNPSGVYFRQGALVNVGEIYAGAGHISQVDFLNGVDRFQGTGAVVNEGVINATKAVLVGQTVVNAGTINTPAGVTVLASGDDILVGEYGGRIFAKVTGANAGQSGTGVDQRGTVNAAGGRAILASGDLYSGAIWHRGKTKAADVTVQGGPASGVRIEGTIDASNATGAGGRVEITAASVRVQGASIDASGATAGGLLQIGGEYQGGGELARAGTTVVDQSTLRADGGSGNGGTIVVWSDGLTGVARSTLSATGGASGAGGLIETSGKGHLDVRGLDVSTTGGHADGLWLLDPSNVRIEGSGDAIPPATNPYTYNPTADNASVDVATLATALGNGNSVTITTNRASTGGPPAPLGTITLVSDLTVAFGANAGRTPTLTLRAADTITLDGSISTTASVGTSFLNLVLSANDPAGSDTAAASGAGGIAVNNQIQTLGGSVSLQVGATTTGQISIAATGSIDTTRFDPLNGGGAVNILTTGAFDAGNTQISGSITSNNGNVAIGNASLLGIVQVQSGGAIDAGTGTITINSRQVQVADALTTQNNSVTLGRSDSTLVQVQSGGTITTNGGQINLVAGNASTVQVDAGLASGGGNVTIGGRTISSNATGTIDSGGGVVSIGNDGNANNINLTGSITTINAAVNILTGGTSAVVTLNGAVRTGGAAVSIGSATNTAALSLANTASLGAALDRVGAVNILGGAVTLSGGIFANNNPVAITAATTVGASNDINVSGNAVTFTLTGAATLNLNSGAAITTAGGTVTLGQLASSGAVTLNSGSSISSGAGTITVRGGPMTVSNSLTTNNAAIVLAPNGTAPLTINSTASILTSGGGLTLSTVGATAGATTINGGATLGSSVNRLGQTRIYGAAIQLLTGLFVNSAATTIGDLAATGVTISGAGIDTSAGAVTIMPVGSAPVAISAPIATAGGNVAVGHAAFSSTIALQSGAVFTAGAGDIDLTTNQAVSGATLTIADSISGATLDASAASITLQLGGAKSITTTGNQTYAFSALGAPGTGGLNLTLAASLVSSGGSITFTGSNQGVIRGLRALTVQAATSVTVSTSLGDGASAASYLGQFSITAPTINLSGITYTQQSGANANGAQTFAGNLILTGSNQQLSANASVATGITVTGNVNAQASGVQSLNVNTAQVAVFGGGIGNSTRLASLTTNATGTTRLTGDVGATGTISFGDAVELLGTLTVSSTGAGALGNIGFLTIDSGAGGPWGLTVNTAGTTTFAGAVGGSAGTSTNLSQLITDAVGSTVLGGATYNLAPGGTFNIQDPASLTAGTTIGVATSTLPTVGTLTFGSTVAGGGNSLVLSALGTGGRITVSGAITNLSTFSSAGGGFGSFRSITSSGSQTFTDAETRLNGTYTITGTAGFGVTNAAVLYGTSTVDNSANNGSITFSSTVDTNTGGPFGLTVNTTGQKIFGGAVGGGANGGLLSLTSTGAGVLELRRDVTTTGTQSYADGLISLGSAGNDITLSTTNNGSINFSNAAGATTLLSNLTATLTGTGVGTFAGTITGTAFSISATSAAGGGLVFSNAAADAVNVRDFTTGNNGTVSLRNVTVVAQSARFILLNGTGAKTLNGTLNAGGTFTVEGPVTLAGTTVVNLTSAAGGRSATFSSTVDGAFALTVNAAGTTDFQGLIGSTTALTGLITDAPGAVQSIGARTNGNINFGGSSATLSGTFNTNASGASNGNFSVTPAVTLAGDTTVSSGSGTIGFGGTVNGAFALAANSTGTTTFAGNVGTLTNGTDGTALTTLTTNAGGTTALPAFVRTTGAINFGDTVTLTAAANRVDAGVGNITFGPDIRGAVANTSGLTAVSTGTITFNTVGGGALPLLSLGTQGPTLTILNGDITLAQNAALAGAIRLDSSVVFNSTGGRWNGPAGQAINAQASGVQSLSITGALSTELGSVGATTALSSLTVTSAQTNFTGSGGAGVTVRTTGNQSYSGAVTVIGPTAGTNFDHTFTASGAGATITFGGILGAGNENDTQAVVIGGGLPTFNGFAAGPAAPFRLRNVTFTSTVTITGDTVFDFGVTPVTFAAVTGTGAGTPHDLTINTSGLTRLTGAFTQIDNFTAGGGGDTCIETNLTIAGNFTFGSLGTPENLCIGGPVPGATTLTYLGMDVFGTTFSAASPAGPRNLTLNSGAALTRFRGSLGVGAADQRLAAVTSNATGSFRADSGANLTGALAVNDTGATSLGGTFTAAGMSVAGAVTMTAGVTLETGNSTVDWSNAAAVTTGGNALTVNNTGTATFAGNLLGLSSLTSDEGGTLNLNGANTTGGDLVLRDTTVNLSGNYGSGNNNITISRSSDSTLTSLNIAGTVQLANTNNFAITINANVANTGANADLDLRPGSNISVPAGSLPSVGTGSVTIGGSVTGVRSLQVVSGNTASLRSVTVTGAAGGPVTGIRLQSATVTLNGTYITNNAPFAVTSSTRVGGSSSVQVGTSTATFTGPVDSTAGNTFDLAVTSTNAAGINFGSTIGAADRLGDLSTSGAGGQTTLTGNVSVARTVSIGHALVLAANTTIDSSDAGDPGDANASSANITITGVTNADAAANNRTLTINTPDSVALGAVGAAQALSGLSVANSGDLTFNGNVTTRGNQTYNVLGTTTFTSASTSFSTNDNAAGGDFQINNPNGQTRLQANLVVTTGSGGALFNNPVNADSAANNRTLTITAGGVTTIGAAFGATQALESLTSNGGGDTNLNASVTTNASQTYADRLFVSGSPTLTVNSDGLNAGATINFNFATRPLNGNASTPATLTTQNGIVRFGASTNILFDTNLFARVNFSASTVEITGDTTFAFSAGNSGTQFDLGPVTGTGAGTPHNLVINSSGGLVRLTGALTQIDNLTTDTGGTTRIEADLSVASDLTFNDAVELAGSGAINRTLTANDITFASTVSGLTQDGVNLVVNSTGSGVTSFQGLVGGAAGSATPARLNSVTTNTDGTVSSVGINAGSSINFNENGAGNVATLSGNFSAFSFSVSDDAALAADTTVTTTGGNLTFSGAISGGGFALTLNDPSATTTITGAATNLRSFETDLTGVQGGSLNLNGLSTTNGGINLRDSIITLASNYTVAANGSFQVLRQSSQSGSTFNTITALRIADGTTTISVPNGGTLAFFAASIDGVGNAGNLVVNGGTGSVVTFGSFIGSGVGGTNRLQSLTVGANGSTVITNLLTGATFGTTIATTGNQTFNNQVTFNNLAAAAAPGPDYTLDASGAGAQLLFNASPSTGASAANRVGLIIAAGTPTFAGSISSPFAFRQITFSGTLNLFGDTVYDFGATPVSFNAVNGTGAGIPHDFTVNTSGLTTLTGPFTNIDNFTAGGGGITCIETNLSIAGDFTLGSLGTPEDLCLGGSVPGTITLTYAGLDVFGQTFSAASPVGARSLTLNGSGTTRFRGVLGRANGSDGVATLTSDNAGTFRADAGGNIAAATINDGTVSLAGTFNTGTFAAPNAVVLTGDTTINSTVSQFPTPVINLGTVDGAFALTTVAVSNGNPSISQFGVIGGGTPLASVNLTGTTLFVTSNVTTTGNQAYGGINARLGNGANGSSITLAVTGTSSTINLTGSNLNADTVTFQSVNGAINFNNIVDIDANKPNGTANLVINSNGTFTASAGIGTNRAITSLTTDAGGSTSLQSVTLQTGAGTGLLLQDATVTLSGTYTTNGRNFAVGDAGVDANVSNTVLGGDTVITTGAGTAFFEGSINSFTPGPSRGLIVTAGGASTFRRSIGDTARLATLLIDGGGTTTFGFNSGTPLVINTGSASVGTTEVDIADAVVLADNLTVDSGTNAQADVRFGSTINADLSANNRTLTVNSAGVTTVVGVIGTGQALAQVTTDEPGSLAVNNISTNGNAGGGLFLGGAGGITLNGASYVSGGTGIVFAGPITLTQAATAINASGGANTGQVDFGTHDSGVPSTVDGPSALTVTAGGNVFLTGDIGGTTPLTSLAVTSTDGVINFGQVSTLLIQTAGDQTYTAAEANLFGTTTLTPGAASLVTFATPAITGFTDATDSLIVTRGNVTFPQATTTFGTALLGLNAIDLSAATLLLPGNTLFTGFTQTFSLGPVTGTGGSRNFTVTLPGTVNLSGAFTSLNNFTSDGGGTTRILTSLGVAGDFTVTDSARLVSAGVRTITATNITFGGTVNSETADESGLLVNSSAAGNTLFSALVGGTGRLLSLETNADGTVSSLGASARDSIAFRETGGVVSIQINGDYRTSATGAFSTAGRTDVAGNTTIGDSANRVGTVTMGIVDGGQTLSVFSTSGATFGAIGQNTPLASLAINDSASLGLSGSVLTVGDQTYTSPLSTLGGSTYRATGAAAAIQFTGTSAIDLANNSVTFRNANGAITLGGAVNADNAANSRSLAFISNGAVTATGALGTTRALQGVTSDAGGSSSFAAITTRTGGTGVTLFDATVTLNGTYTTNGANFAVGDNGVDANVSNALLAGNTVIDATGGTNTGTIFFEGTVDSTGGTPRTLTATAPGLTTFSGVLGTAIGSANRLGQVTLNGTGAVSANSIFTTSGGVNFANGGTTTLTGTTYHTNGNNFLVSGPVTLSNANTTVTGGGVQFNSAIDGASNLVFNGTGNLVLFRSLGAGTPLASLDVSNHAAVLFGNASPITVATNNGLISLAAPVSIFQNATFSAGNANITFASTVNGNTNGGQSLTVNTTGDTIFARNVGTGTNQALASITTNAGGRTVFRNTAPGAVTGSTVTTTGNQTYNDRVVFDNVPAGADYILNTNTGSTVAFTSNLAGAPDNNVSLQGGAVDGSNNGVNGLTINGGSFSAAGSVGGLVANSNFPLEFLSLNGALVLTGNTVINLGSTPITINTVTGNNFSLTINTSGLTRLTGPFTNVFNYTSGGGGATCVEANLTVSNVFTLGSSGTPEDLCVGGPVPTGIALSAVAIEVWGNTYSMAGGARDLSITLGAASGSFVGQLGTVAAPLRNFTTSPNNVGNFQASTGGNLTGDLTINTGSANFAGTFNVTGNTFIRNSTGINATTAFNSTSGTFTANGPVFSGSPTYDLTVSTNAAVTFAGPVATSANRLNRFQVYGAGGVGTAAGTTALSDVFTTGSLFTRASAITLNGSTYNVSGTGTSPLLNALGGTITLANATTNVTVSAGGAGASAQFGGPVVGNSALTVNAPGDVLFQSTVGDAFGTRLTSLLATSTAGNITLARSVSTSGVQTYTASTGVTLGSAAGPLSLTTTNSSVTFSGAAPIALSDDVYIDAGSGNIAIGGAVDGAHVLSLFSTGTTTLHAVGQTTALSQLQTNAGGLTDLNANVRATTILFSDSVRLLANLVANGSGGVTFQRSLSSPNGSGLQVISAGTTSFGSGAGDTIGALGNPLGYLRTDAPGFALLNVSSIDTTAGGDVTILENALVSTSLDVITGTGAIRFGGTITTPGDLFFSTTGQTRLDGNITARSLTTNTGGTTLLNASSITTTQAAEFADAVTLGSNLVINSGTDLVFGSTIDGPFTLTLNAPGSTEFSGNIGSGTRLAGLSIDAGGSTNLALSSIRTTGPVTFGDALTLGSDVDINTNSAGSVTFNNTINTLASAPAERDLTVTGTTIAVNGQIGDTRALNTVSLNATTTTLNPHITPGSTGVINVTTTFGVDAGSTLLARDLIITGGSGFVGFAGSLDSATGTPRSLTINAPGAGSEVYFNWNAGPGIGTINPLQSLTVNNAGTIYLGWSSGYTGPVAINLAGGPAVVEGQLTAPPVGLFLDGNVLLAGDTSINAGNGRVIFTRSINTDAATPRSLSVFTNATRAAPPEFSRPLSSMTDAQRLALFNDYRAGIIFGGSIGNASALNNLFLGYDGAANDGRLSVPAFSTILFANTFDSTGRVQAGPAGVDFSTVFTLRANRISMGFNEKLLVLGTLNLNTSINPGARLDLGDITAIGSINAFAPDIRIRSRGNTLGAPYTNANSLVFGFATNNIPTEGTDEGTSFVSGDGITFSSGPVSVAQNFTSPSTNPDPQFSTPDGQDISVPGAFRTRSYFAGAGDQNTLISEFLTRDLNSFPLSIATNNVGFIQFSRRAQGPTNVNVSETVTPIIIVEVPLLNPPSTLGQALADQLSEIGFKIRLNASPEELIDFLVGRNLYNDRPLSSDPTDEEYQTSAGRLSLDQVNLLLERVTTLRARADEFRTGLDEAYTFFLEGREGLDFDPAAFRDMVLALDNDSPARQAFALLVELFNRIDQLGLGPNEARQVKIAVLRVVQGEAPLNNLYDAISAAQKPAQTVGEPQAALP